MAKVVDIIYFSKEQKYVFYNTQPYFLINFNIRSIKKKYFYNKRRFYIFACIIRQVSASALTFSGYAIYL